MDRVEVEGQIILGKSDSIHHNNLVEHKIQSLQDVGHGSSSAISHHSQEARIRPKEVGNANHELTARGSVAGKESNRHAHEGTAIIY